MQATTVFLSTSRPAHCSYMPFIGSSLTVGQRGYPSSENLSYALNGSHCRCLQVSQSDLTTGFRALDRKPTSGLSGPRPQCSSFLCLSLYSFQGACKVRQEPEERETRPEWKGIELRRAE